MIFGCGGGGSGSTTSTCQNYTASRTVSPLWIELNPSAPLPDERYSSSTAYDSVTDSLILFGGTGNSTYFNDTWVLSKASGASGTPVWNELSTSGTPPSGRYYSIVGYNTASKVLAVFGGVNGTTILADLFRLSNANGVGASVWTTTAITGTSPNPNRIFMTGVYDESTDTIIFFGGRQCVSSACTLYDETWTIQNVTTGTPIWTQQLAPTGTKPSARAFHSSVYDSKNNRMIIFGGNNSTSSPSATSSALDDTWVLSNANGVGGTPVWTELNPSAQPDSRFTHSAIYDSTKDRMTIYAGIDVNNSVMPDVWVLVNSLSTPQWIKYNTGSPAPRARAYQSVAFTDNRMVMFGGNLGDNNFVDDTWVLQNANGMPTNPVARIVIDSASTTVCTTKINQLVAIAYDADGEEIPGAFFEWSSSDTSIATVDSDGFVTAIKEGTVTITVSINGISKTITLTITSDDSGGGGGDVGECSINADCSDYCGDTGTWASGASGAAINGHCLSCNEVGTNCDADANVSCYAADDVCLFYY